MNSGTVSIKTIPKLTIGDRVGILKNKRSFSLVFPLLVLLIIISLFGVATNGSFFKSTVLVGILNQALITGTMATAVAFIYTTGNLDISVGAVMGLGATIGAIVYNINGSVPMMLISAIAVSMVLMLLNCTLSLIFNVKSALVAIVMMQLYSAIIQELLGAEMLTVNFKVSKALENGGYRYIAFIVYFILCIVVFHFTTVGRQLKLVGGNEKCAVQTGINPKRIIFISFIMAGLGVGLASTFSIIRTSSIAVSIGSGMGMDVMLATVLGGMSIFGGSKSNSYSGIIGALTVSTLNKGMLMVGVSATLIQGIRGVIFLLLVLLNSERPSTLPSRQQF